MTPSIEAELAAEYYAGMDAGEKYIAQNVRTWAEMGLSLEEILDKLAEGGLL
jgi:hypothetical protein